MEISDISKCVKCGKQGYYNPVYGEGKTLCWTCYLSGNESVKKEEQEKKRGDKK